jgi:hypothetical protein
VEVRQVAAEGFKLTVEGGLGVGHTVWAVGKVREERTVVRGRPPVRVGHEFGKPHGMDRHTEI